MTNKIVIANERWNINKENTDTEWKKFQVEKGRKTKKKDAKWKRTACKDSFQFFNSISPNSV